jgi:uncharacterized protein HemX
VIKAGGQFSRPGIWVILGGVVLAILTVFVGVHTPPNALATGLLQAFTLIVTLVGAYIFAQPAAEKAAKAAETAAQDKIRVHARSAFRRQLGLYKGLGRLIDEIDLQANQEDDEKVQLKLKILRAMIVEQVGMSGDALSDWRDLVPDEVAQLEGPSPLAKQGEVS